MKLAQFVDTIACNLFFAPLLGLVFEIRIKGFSKCKSEILKDFCSSVKRGWKAADPVESSVCCTYSEDTFPLASSEPTNRISF